MKKIIAIAFVSLAFNVCAQQYNFSTTVYKDSSSFQKAVVQFANSTDSTFTEPHKIVYHDLKLRIAFIKNDASGMQKHIDSFIKSSENKPSNIAAIFAFKIYGLIALHLDASQEKNFIEEFAKTYKTEFNKLEYEVQDALISNYNYRYYNPAYFENEIETLIGDKQILSDTDALDLLYLYAEYSLYKKLWAALSFSPDKIGERLAAG